MQKSSIKIGIVTLYGNYNYGNRLQNYALQESLKKLGCEAETFKIDIKSKKTNLFKRIIKNFFNIKKINNYILNKISDTIYKNNCKIRHKKFVEFTNKYICEAKYILTENISNEIVKKYHYFIVGSDQVWNPYSVSGQSLYFLSFAPKFKRISYAASFGISEFPEQYHAEYKEYLNDFKCISVREAEGAQIVNDLTNREVPVVLDPTLLLIKEEWLEIADNSNVPNEKYLLIYFLGKMSKEDKRHIKQYAKKYNLKIVDLMDKRNKDIYTSCPRKFLGLINNSTLFCTNSFHGTVFAILFEKPFIVFERETSFGSMFSRIDTLLSTVKLESRISNNLALGEELICDFSHVEEILNQEREKSINYLKMALDIEK